MSLKQLQLRFTYYKISIFTIHFGELISLVSENAAFIIKSELSKSIRLISLTTQQSRLNYMQYRVCSFVRVEYQF